ncbi:hypothetical protein CGMCC3_g9421 [Colletotrichum fructicola]|nr:uncharacterized protein CGMCC3_g9421 [Colletotrichum fructicola]KAE9574490.1 hypothetical protein CGMCC3_g9421 [Colletotrichum fructicola]
MHLPFNIKALQRSLGASITPGTPEMSLDAAGLVALADLTTVQKRTALTGTSSLLDSFILCPGMHMQQDSTSLNGGEYPACGALTSGYVFRVENPATGFSNRRFQGLAHQIWVFAILKLKHNAFHTTGGL